MSLIVPGPVSVPVSVSGAESVPDPVSVPVAVSVSGRGQSDFGHESTGPESGNPLAVTVGMVKMGP